MAAEQMTVSFALMCHPSRKRFVTDLERQIPDAVTVWDSNNDRWTTGRNSLLAFDPAADWHCVVQDDAIPCKDFVAGVEKLVQAVDQPRVIALYTGKVRPHQNTVTPAYKRARDAGSPWLALEGPWWGVAIIVPTAHIPELVAWGDKHPSIKNYDKRIAAYYTQRKIDCWYTVPSLVDHRPVAENPSLIPERTGNRTAHWFIGDGSPLDVDWSRPPLSLNATFKRGDRTLVAPFDSARFRRLSRHPEWEQIAA